MAITPGIGGSRCRYPGVVNDFAARSHIVPVLSASPYSIAEDLPPSAESGLAYATSQRLDRIGGTPQSGSAARAGTLVSQGVRLALAQLRIGEVQITDAGTDTFRAVG